MEPHDGERPTMQYEDFEAVSRGVYDEEKPLVMKVDRQHLVVDGDDGVPRGTLGVPRETVEELDIRNPPALKEVLLAKQGHAARILGLGGG